MHTHDTTKSSFVPAVAKANSGAGHTRPFQVVSPQVKTGEGVGPETAKATIQARLDQTARLGRDLTKPQSTLQRQVAPDLDKEDEEEKTIQRQVQPGIKEDEEEEQPLQRQVKSGIKEDEEEEALIQPKLTMGQPGDQYEQEADAMAQRVMAMRDDEVQARVQTAQASPKVQAKGTGHTVPAGFEQQLASKRSGGSPLSDEIRAFMEPRFGADFSNVRVHETPDLANAIQAQAFTHGQDIYFNAGKYNPGSSGGKELLAHELTHTLQQTAVNIQPRSSDTEQSSTFWSWYNSSKGKKYQQLREKLEKLGYEFHTRIAVGTKANGSMLWQSGYPKKDTFSKEIAWSIRHPNGKWSWVTINSIIQKCRALISTSITYWEWWRSKEGQHYDQLRKDLKKARYKFIKYIGKQGNFQEKEPDNSTRAKEVSWSIGLPGQREWIWATTESVVTECQSLQKSLRGDLEAESLGSQISSHSIYELIAKDIAYVHSTGAMERKLLEDKDISVDQLNQWGIKLENIRITHGYYGFQMTSIRWSNTPVQESRLPVIAFEGSKEILDWIEDANAEGIGAKQFQKSKRLIEKEIVNLGGKVDVTGHSLGGALAQITAATFPQNVSKVITFQAPGIDSRLIDSLEEYNSKAENPERVESFHYRASTGNSLLGGMINYDGDVVDDAGQQFTPGGVYKLPTELFSSTSLDSLAVGRLVGGLPGAVAGYHGGQMYNAHTTNLVRNLLDLKESDPEAFRELAIQANQANQTNNMQEFIDQEIRPAEHARHVTGTLIHGSLENLTSDDRVRERVLRESNYLDNKGVSHKIKMIKMLIDGMVSDEDVVAIEKICDSVQSADDGAKIYKEIEPLTGSIMSFSKRMRIRVALSKL
ncbi:MAG: DUF4157 domain-containing protein [Cyanobacteria bacterium P01_F01_bin.56]